MEKICFITPQFKTGGGNRVFVELANELIGKNNVEIIYPKNSLEKNTFQLNQNIKIFSIGRYYDSKILRLINLFYCLIWIRKNRKNSKLIITDPIMSLFYFMLPQKNLYRFVQADDYRIFDDKFILKNEILLKVYKILTKLSYKSNKIMYIFNSRYVYDNFIKNSNNKVGCRLVHPSINKDIFYDMGIRDENELNICIVARKHPLKGFVTFIDAWKKISSLLKINNVYIISHDDLSEFDLSDQKFKLVRPKSDKEIAYFMNKSHIFVSTSWWEGFGLPPLEAMACGCCVVTSDSGGINEYAIDNYNCLIYTPKDSDLLVKKIEILINNKIKRKELLENSRKTIQKFSWKKSTNSFIKILNEE